MSTSSAYAEEGTKAHEVAAAILLGQPCPASTPFDMLAAVNVYVEAVREVAEGKPKEHVFIEHRFDLSDIFPGLFGTADAVVYDAAVKRLHVFDYKHGQGIAVEAEGNQQLMYYALGAAHSLGLGVATVELVIVQPRCPHPMGPVRRWEFDSLDLIDFAADVAFFATRTQDPHAELVAGEHCRFCPACAICPEVQKQSLELAKEEFSAAFSYDPKKLSHVLEQLPMLENFIKQVREFAYQEASKGQSIPGWKLVAKRPTRRWKDEETTVAAIQLAADLPEDELYDRKIKSPAQMEKLLGKDSKKVIAELTVSESSGATLVHESDPRPPYLADVLAEFQVIPSDSCPTQD